MMTALATVTKVVPAQQGFQVTLSCEQKTSCSSNQSSKSCGTGIVSRAFGNKTLFWRLQTTQALEAGEVVEIGLPERACCSRLRSSIYYRCFHDAGNMAWRSIAGPYVGF